MRHSFYDSPEYRLRQSRRTAALVRAGKYEHLRKQVSRTCIRTGCKAIFSTQPSDPKRYCSQKCAALVNTPGRKLSEETKARISASLKGTRSPFKGIIKVKRPVLKCSNPWCTELFIDTYYHNKRFCSIVCAAKRPTSPKASRGKAGIRHDINSAIYFYSRWEANIARLYTYLGVKWQYAPRTFDIGGHMYTPDFYLPETDTYVEVKNFLGEYSRIRDQRFRTRYPNLALKIVLKDEYQALEDRYAHQISNWEYKTSK